MENQASGLGGHLTSAKRTRPSILANSRANAETYKLMFIEVFLKSIGIRQFCAVYRYQDHVVGFLGSPGLTGRYSPPGVDCAADADDMWE